jgi:hypothetical protein
LYAVDEHRIELITPEGTQARGVASDSEQGCECADGHAGHASEVRTRFVVEPGLSPIEKPSAELRMQSLVLHDTLDRRRYQRTAGEITRQLEQGNCQDLPDAGGPDQQLCGSKQGIFCGGGSNQSGQIDLKHNSTTKGGGNAGRDFDVNDLVTHELTGESDEIDRGAGRRQCGSDLRKRGGAGVFAERGLGPR